MSEQTQLFGMALGVSEPIYIKGVRFDAGIGELHIDMDFRKGGKFPCSECGAQGCAVHDTTDKTWRHLNFFQYKCYLHFRTPRTKCDTCGERLYVPAWSSARSGFTLLFEAFVMTLAAVMPMNQIAKLVGEQDTLLWRIFGKHVDAGYERKEMSEVTRVSIDETSMKKGHDYITVVVDADKRETLYCTPGKDKSTVSSFLETLEKHGGDRENITAVSMDMSPAYISAANEYLPNASITYDKFHVIKLMNEAVDQVRREEQRTNPLLKNTRYVWLKNPGNLTKRQQEKLETVSKENTRTGRAYRIKLTLQDVYRFQGTAQQAETEYKKWRNWAMRSQLDPVKSVAKTIKQHWTGVLNYFTTRLTAGPSEGLNSLIQAVKRRARGFRNPKTFIRMIYWVSAGIMDDVLGRLPT